MKEHWPIEVSNVLMKMHSPIAQTEEHVLEENLVAEPGDVSSVEAEPEDVVYVGSHSHLFLAIDFRRGRVLWRSELGGRVESSACSSVCGTFVIVGKTPSSFFPLKITIFWLQ